MTMRAGCRPVAPGQAGAALVMGLIFLVLLTMLGVTAFGISGLEERMSGHSRDRMLAFQAAEAALRDCEVNGLGGGYAVYTDQVASRWLPTNAVWTGNNSTSYAGAVSGVSAPPRCILEEMERKNCTGDEAVSAQKALNNDFLYRVTARGVGASADTVVLLQTVFHACN